MLGGSNELRTRGSELEGFGTLLGLGNFLEASDQLFDASWVGDGAKLADVFAEGIDGGGAHPCQFVEVVAIDGYLVRFGDGRQGIVDTAECWADPFAGDICGDVFDELAQFSYAFGKGGGTKSNGVSRTLASASE